jgi:archaellum component FlaC
MADDNFKELGLMITELKLSTERMSSRLEQTCDSIERLEESIKKVDAAVSSQERRLIVLEESIPDNLLADLALMKDGQALQKKIMWGVIASIVAMWAKTVFNLMPPR